MPTKQQLEILEKFKSESTLHTLDLGGFGLGPENILDVGAIIRSNQDLENIILCHNGFGDLLSILFNLIFQLPKIKMLDIVDNNITLDSTYQSLGVLIRLKPTLESVYIGAKILIPSTDKRKIPLVFSKSPLGTYASFFNFLRRNPQTMRLEYTNVPGEYDIGFNEISRSAFFDLRSNAFSREMAYNPLRDFFLVSHDRTKINRARILGSEKLLQLEARHDPKEYRRDTETMSQAEELFNLC